MTMQAQKISLLDLINDVTNKTTNNKNINPINFLFELLKNIDDKNFVKDLIEKSNLTKDQKQLLLNKLNIKTLKNFNIDKNLIETNLKEKNFLNIPNKKNTSKNLLQTNVIKNLSPITKNDKQSKKTEILKTLLENKKEKTPEKTDISINIQTLLLLPKNKQTEIVKEIKKLIQSKASQNKTIQTLISLKEFKNVTNIKDLINLTKKFNLNLEKIIFKQETSITKPTLKPKIIEKEILPFQIKHNLKIKKDQNTLKIKTKNFQNKNEEISLNKLLDKFSENKQTKQISFKHEKNHDNTQKNNTQKNDLNIISHSLTTSLKQKIVTAKQTLKHFASTLKEAVENYKPPVTKLTLELHPKEIGKVEVVIKQRGENLQVQISTNNQTTINFLTSQQQELKNNLVNMGFTNINMNFNSNGQNKKHQHERKQEAYQTIENEEPEELIIDFTYKYA